MPQRKAPRGRGHRHQMADQRAQQDAEHRDRAAQTLAGDPDTIRAWIRTTVTSTSPRIISYSLRNQILLHNQVTERGITLTDVDTVRGWNARGRKIRSGQHGLRINRFRGTPTEGRPAEGSPNTSEATNPEEKAPRPRFSMISVFDISQTEPVAAAPEAHDCPACGAGAGVRCSPGCACQDRADAADNTDDPDISNTERLWNSLREQLADAGYRIATGPRTSSTPRVFTDHATHTVHVAHPDPSGDIETLADLAADLATILARSDAEKSASRQAQTSTPTDPITT